MVRFLLAIVLTAAMPAALAQGDAAAGRKLVEEKKCEACHQKTHGKAKPIYLRENRKVTSWEKLKAQVAMCNSELNLGLFPEDEEHVAAFLDQAYYKLRK